MPLILIPMFRRARALAQPLVLTPVLSLSVLLAVVAAEAQAQRGAPPAPPARPTAPAPATAPSPLALTVPLADFDFPDLAPLAMSIDARALAVTARAAAAVSIDAARDAARAGIEAARLSGAFDIAPALAFTFESRNYRTQAPASWAPQDAADSLYRAARRALSNDNYIDAASLFRKIREQYPKSSYTPDAYYWEAFAMQRTGQRSSLNTALELLEAQQEKFPKASTRGDASALRTRVEGQLARLGDQNAIASLADRARNATSDGCPREQDDERIDALNAVMQMDPEKAMPILKKVLARREACTQRLRRTAVWLVASRRQAEAADILLNVARTDPDKEVREQAVFWMANVPTDEATTMLIDLAKKGDDLDLRKRAIYSLSRSKSPRAATTLREIVLDPNSDDDLRGDALSWYMSGPGKTAEDQFGFLKDVYGRADDVRFKQRVLQVIASRRSDESRTFLVDIAQNAKESMEIRRAAIWSLQGSGVTGAQLATIYDRGTDVEVRKQVIGVLGSLRDNGGVDKLLEIARNEKNLELRKQAINYLTRSKDPRALALLQEIIEK